MFIVSDRFGCFCFSLNFYVDFACFLDFLSNCTPGIILHNYRAAKVIASTCEAGSCFSASYFGLLSTDGSTLPRYCKSVFTRGDVAESFSLWARRRVLIESMTGPGQGLMTSGTINTHSRLR